MSLPSLRIALLPDNYHFSESAHKANERRASDVHCPPPPNPNCSRHDDAGGSGALVSGYREPFRAVQT